MAVVQAKIQTVEDIYRLVWAAVVNKQPMEAIYDGRPRLFVLTAWAGIRQRSLGCCATNMAEKAITDWKRKVRRQTGAALRWRNSAN